MLHSSGTFAPRGLKLDKDANNQSESIMTVRWQDRIVSSADVLKGKPRIKNTRIPAALILGYLAAGATTDEIVAEFPELTPADITACLDYSRDLADFEAV